MLQAVLHAHARGIAIFVSLVCVCFCNKQVNAVGCPGVTYDEFHEVLILGGGMSGIAAGSALRDNDINADFVILEGYSKVGGRLRKMDFAGGTIELGANWIQGHCKNDNCNPISNIADGTMLSCSIDSEDQNRSERIFYDKNGNKYNDPEIIVYPNEKAFETYRTSAMLMNDVTVRTALDNIPSWKITLDSEKKRFVEWYHHDSCFAAPPEETSLFETHPLPTYRDFGDRTRLVTDSRGYESILSCILSSSSNKFRLNTIVTKIRNNQNCVCVDTVHSENSNSLKTYCGEYAIVTFSIGVLQAKRSTLFEPELSQRKITAINSFTMPLYLKIYLHFNSALWEVSKHINGRKDSDMYDYIGYASETRGHYPLFVPLPNNVLMAVVTHPFADQVSQQNENIIQQNIMTILRQIYGNSIPDPDQMYIHHWETDPLFLGTYSNTPVGVTRSTHETLAEREGRLFFAGEAASADYSGFVHGAYFAGKDSGNIVAAALSAGSTTSNPCTKSDGVSTKQCPPSNAPTNDASLNTGAIVSIVIGAFLLAIIVINYS